MPPRGLRLAPPGAGAAAAAPPPPPAADLDFDASPPPPAPDDFDSPRPAAPRGSNATAVAQQPPPPAPAAAAAAGQQRRAVRGPPPSAAAAPVTAAAAATPAPAASGANTPSKQLLRTPPPAAAAAAPHELPPAGMVSDPETAGRSHGRKKTDVTMRAEYELELDRRKDERDRAAVEAGRSGATPPGEMNGDDELAAAKEALQAALSRQQATERDLRLAKREAQAGTAPGSSRGGAAAAGSSPTVAPRDAQIRQLNPAQLAAEAKARRDGIEAQRRAEREHKENAIFRGPEVAAVSQAARAVKQETEAMCGFMLESLETAVNQLREERDQLRLRLERAEAGLNSDIARVEGELSWIDFASSQCKKSLDDANLRKQARDKRPATPKSTWR